MAEPFTEQDKNDLIERGFNTNQIDFLESLELDKEDLYLNICKTMDDYGDTPKKVIDTIHETFNAEPQVEPQPKIQQEGGKRRTRRTNRNTRKSRKNMRKKSIKNMRRKSIKNMRRKSRR